MSVVLDSSMTLSWLFAEEQTPAGLAVMHQAVRYGAHAPSLWPLEVANALQMGIRRGRITATQRDASLADLKAIAVTIDSETAQHAWGASLLLADQFKLTVYDASYVELARRLAKPLASLDQAMCAAATQLGIEVIGL